MQAIANRALEKVLTSFSRTFWIESEAVAWSKRRLAGQHRQPKLALKFSHPQFHRRSLRMLAFQQSGPRGAMRDFAKPAKYAKGMNGSEGGFSFSQAPTGETRCSMFRVAGVIGWPQQIAKGRQFYITFNRRSYSSCVPIQNHK